MEQIIIQKINNGDTGHNAANKIYRNDTNLKAAITEIKDYLDAYGDLVQLEAEIDGAGIRISLEQGPGSGTTAVMSQNAVTQYVINSVSGNCRIGEEIGTITDMPSTTDYVDMWVSRASSNADGHSLTTLYNDVEDLKGAVITAQSQVIADLQEELTNLGERIAMLEQYIRNNMVYETV